MPEKNGKALWARFKARMKRDKKFEGAVYLALLLLIGLLYLSLRQPAKPKTEAPGPTPAVDTVENRLASTLSCMRGVGEVRVMLTYRATESGAEEIQGVLVIAEGAQDVAVRLRLQNAVQTALGVEAERVDVFAMHEKEEAVRNND